MSIIIHQERCHGCGQCRDICPRHIPEVEQTSDGLKATVSPERSSLCINCGHCLLVCPHQAIETELVGLHDMEESTSDTGETALLWTLLKKRRSVRRFERRAIDPELLDQIAKVVHYSPQVTSAGTMGVIIVHTPNALKTLTQSMVTVYDGLVKALKTPIGKWAVKRKVGDRFDTVDRFLKPALKWYLKWYHEGSRNEITRDAAAIMLFYAPADEPEAQLSCAIAAQNAILMATSLGLGSLYNGLIPDGINRSEAARDQLQLPEDHNVFAALSIGYPHFKLTKTIRRRAPKTRYY